MKLGPLTQEELDSCPTSNLTRGESYGTGFIGKILGFLFPGRAASRWRILPSVNRWGEECWDVEKRKPFGIWSMVDSCKNYERALSSLGSHMEIEKVKEKRDTVYF